VLITSVKVICLHFCLLPLGLCCFLFYFILLDYYSFKVFGIGFFFYWILVIVIYVVLGVLFR
jgi:hypothetical protein